MKHTPFTQKHIELGAKMSPFAGYNMPISYTGINDEHATVRKSVGVFDVSHMGEFSVKGADALPLIQHITTNDAAKLKPGAAQYTCFLNEAGGILDDLIVYCLQENDYMLVVNAGNIDKDWGWVIQHSKSFDVSIENISDTTGLLAVQGPAATKVVQSLTEMDVLNLKFYHFVKGPFAGVKDVIISATGYTGSGGVEIYFEDKDDNASRIWDALFEAGKSEGIKPVGLGARDTLRLEMGYCLYGNDIDENTNPYEANLGWITKLAKEGFIGKAAVEKVKAEGAAQKLVGFEMVDRGIPRSGYEIKDAEGQIIGRVTSGTQSPSLNKAIGLGYIRKDAAVAENEIFIVIRNSPTRAKIVKFPFE